MPTQYSPLKLGFSRLEVAAFKSRWPASNLRDRAYWFEFDEEGDLVDTDVPEHDDGAAAVALSHDAWNILQGESVDWL